MPRWIQNIINSIIEMVNRALANALAGMFNAIGELMALIRRDLANRIATTPEEFATDMGIWDVMVAIWNNAVMPIAIVIFAFFVMYEFIQMAMDKNNFKDFETSVFVRWFLKVLCCLLVLTNFEVFTNGMFTFGAFMVERAGFAAANTVQIQAFTADDFYPIIARPGVGMFYFIVLCIMGAGQFLLMGIVYIGALVAIINRLLEAIVYMSVAPIPFATLANQEFGNIGKNYIKCLFALSLQGFLMFFVLVVYQAMVANNFANIQTTLQTLTGAGATMTDGQFWNFIGAMSLTTVYSIVLLMMLFKTSAISKSIMTAQ